MQTPASDGVEEVLKPVVGYHSRIWKQALYIATVLCTLGVSWMFAMLLPAVMILLRLRPCSVQSASFVKVVQLHSSRASLLRVFIAAYGRAAPAAGVQQGAGSAMQLVQLYGYWYGFSRATGMFERVPRMPSDLCQQLGKALHALSAIDEGADWTHFNAPGSWPRQQRLVMHGTNSSHISSPILITLVLNELVKADFVIPILLMALWMYGFSYFYYPAVLMAVMIVGTAISVGLTYRQHQSLYKLFTYTQLVPYVRKGYVRATVSQRLIPGDVIVVQPGMAVCDMVLLRGNCLVEASKLSGEALQMRKIPYLLEQVDDAKYDPDIHNCRTILSGCVIQQVWNDQDEQDECLAMVVRTGLNTTVGYMMRPLLHSHWARKHLRSFMGFYREDVAKFFLSAGVVQLITFIIVAPGLIWSHASARIVLYALLARLIDATVPGLAAVLLFVRVITLMRLRHQGVIVSDTHKMLIAGHLDVVLFDKTGTLTNEQGKLHGIIPCEHGQLAGLKSEAVAWGSDIKRMLALCHDLVPISKGQIVGPLDEQKAFAAVEASFQGRNTICLPLRASRNKSARQVQFEVLRRFDYDPGMMMSGVIAKSKSSTHCERAQVLIKGGAHEVSQLTELESLPTDLVQYHVVYGFTLSLMGTIVDVANSAGGTTAYAQITLGKYSFVNYVGLVVAFGFVWTHASPHLHPAKPPPRLISVNVLAPIALFMGLFTLELGIAVGMLQRQSWYHPQESKAQLVATVMLNGLAQVLAPAVSFMIDMQPHCPRLYQEPLVPLIIYVVFTVGIVWVLYPAGFGGSLLRQRHLPFSFRVKLLVFMAAFAVVLIICMRVLRRCLAGLHQRRRRKITLDFFVPTNTDRPGSSEPLQSSDAHDAVLRSTDSTDVGAWLRRTASAIADVTTALPGRPNNEIPQGQLSA